MKIKTLPIFSQHQEFFKLFLLSFSTISLILIIQAISQDKDIRNQASEVSVPIIPNLESKYVQGEVIVKLKATAGNLQVKKDQAVDLDTQPVNFADLDQASLAPVIKAINNKYPIRQISKVFKKEASFTRDIQLEARNEQEKVELANDLSRIYKITFNQDIPIDLVILEYSRNADIEYIEPNYVVYALTTPNDPYYLDQYPDNLIQRDPTWDPPYDYQWNLKNINMEPAWDTNRGSEDILVAVIDTGVDYTHPELGGCTRQQLDLNECHKVASGIDTFNGGNEPMDDMGHGTFVAGIITAETDNQVGLAGIEWQGRILPVKVLDKNGFGSLISVASGMVWAVDHGANVLNLSLGFRAMNEIPETLKLALDYAESYQVAVVAAAGNSSIDTANSFWPTNYHTVISVGATIYDDTLAPFSNYGIKIDAVAPGHNIVSLRAKDTNMSYPGHPSLSVINEIYYRSSGTSFSAPHVSGLAALLLAQDNSLSPAEIKGKLRNGADDLGNSGFDLTYGYGRINADQSLHTPIPPTAVITSPSFKQKVFKPIEIIGAVGSRDIVSYTLSLGKGLNPESWSDQGVTLVVNQPQVSFQGLLGTLDPAVLEEEDYILKLEVTNQAGIKSEWRTNITIDKSFRSGFPFSTSEPIANAPVIADLNNNGTSEIVIASENGNIYVIDSNGALLSGWPQTTTGFIFMSPALADLNHDGFKEIIINDSNEISVYDYLGNKLWSRPTSNHTNAHIIGHFSQSQEWEIMAFGFDGTVEIYSRDGQPVLNQPLFNPEVTSRFFSSSQAIYDFDQDGIDEIFIAGNLLSSTDPADFKLYAFKVLPTDQGGFVLNQVKEFVELEKCRSYNAMSLTGPTIGDVDQDGQMDVVMGCVDTSFVGVWEINSQQLKWSYSWAEYPKQESILYPYIMTTPMTLANIDNDKELELIAQTYSYNSDRSNFGSGIVVFENGGEIKAGWPFQNNAFTSFSSPIVADLDNDGVNEILAGEGVTENEIGRAVYALESDGTLLSGWPKFTSGSNRSSLAVGDLDHNGSLEIVVTSMDGNLYVWDTQALASQQTFEWPQNLHDERHTATNINPISVPTPTETPALRKKTGRGKEFITPTPSYHSECQVASFGGFTCVLVQGPGQNQCTSNLECYNRNEE